MNGSTPQIVQYQGSKRILAPQILQYMPRHFNRLVEPFAGVSYAEFVEAVDELNRRGVDCLISYNGVCGDKKYGEDLPEGLNLRKVMLKAGLSSQSILLVNKKITYETLYVSRGLWEYMPRTINQPTLFEPRLAV